MEEKKYAPVGIRLDGIQDELLQMETKYSSAAVNLDLGHGSQDCSSKLFDGHDFTI